MTILQNLEKAYVVAALLFLTGAGVAGNIGAGGLAGHAQPQPWENVARLAFCATLLPFLMIHWRKVFHGLRHSGWIVALCGLALLSTVWSYDPRFTLRHAIFLWAVTLFAVFIASCYDWDEQMNLFGWLSVLVVFGSACAAIFLPAYGLSTDLHLGSVKGIYPQKNTMSAMVVFVILVLVFGKPKAIPGWLRTTTLIGACILLILSNSATALVALLFCIAMYPVVHLMRIPSRKTLPVWVPLVPLFAMGALLAIGNFDIIAESAGRNATLTSRIPMWKEVLNAIGRNPWLGYGYDVFWVEWSRDLQKVLYVLGGWRPPHAHNGYLDILLSVGIVGLLIFFGGFITSLRRAGRVFRANESCSAKFALFVLLFFAVLNLGESYILRLMSFFWIPYVTIYVSLGLAQVELKQLASETAGFDEGEVGEASGVNVALPGYQT
jgi:exopolysaccharide production protein ExoQ